MKTSGILVVLCLALALALPAAPAHAAELGFFGVDLHGGATFPNDWDSGPVGGVSVNVAELVDGLYLYPGVFYSKAEDSATFSVAPGISSTVDLEITDLALGAEVRYFLAGEPAGWYFGGGAYLNMLKAELGATTFNQRVTVIEEDNDEVGAMGVAGYRLPMGSAFSLGLEARYNLVSDFNGGQLLVTLGFGGGR